MSVAKTVLKNVAASWVGFASQVLVTFFLTPFVIRELGTEAYGVWLLLQGLVGYYGLVDMGLRSGLTQSITRRIAADDYGAVRRHIAAAIPLLGSLALVIMVAASVLAFFLPDFVEMSEEIAQGIWIVVLIQAVGAAVRMPVTPYGAVLVGLQRYDVANAITVLTRIVFALLTWWVLSAGGGLIELSIVLAATNCLDGLLRMQVAKYLLPDIRGCGLTLNRTELKEITNVGIWNFMIGIGRQFIYFSDTIVVGILFSAKAVAPYGIAASLIDYGNKVLVMSTRVLFPTMTHLSQKGNLTALRTLYFTTTRLSVGLSATILIVGAAWIGSFLRLWLGDTPENAVFFEQAPGIFAVLGLAFLFVGSQRAGTQLLLAEKRLKLLAILMFSEAALNLVFSLIFGMTLGPIGIAVGTLVPAILLSLFYHIPAHANLLQLPTTQLLLSVATRPLCYGILLSAAILGFRSCVTTPESWWHFLLVVSCSSAIGGILGLALLLSKDQRVTVFSALRKPIGRFAARSV